MFYVFVCVCWLLYFFGGPGCVSFFFVRWVLCVCVCVWGGGGGLYFNLYKVCQLLSLLLFSILCSLSFTLLSYSHNLFHYYVVLFEYNFHLSFDFTVTSTIYTQSTSSEK